ncbi:SusC/RagA family TonB-linked outer membrane protein [Hoylesella nanceiensis]|uniref:SusC/RagA family TonB-linked outer membrane protein n=1 Tax=Hoylesella nanceiensis TaxID=425941 RepID=A0ABS6YBA5_9BACT|nr:SusC/RagA family TonB-linked outer membrane protein [Hoylesella nanceiensis]MBW4768846.1 SusC/RagA family TonB-linked outer membrane protein [Hoylesella nanceiensis]
MSKQKKQIMTLCFLLGMNAGAMAQNVQMKLGKVSVKQAIATLKDKSGYSFVYEMNDLDLNKKVDVNATTLSESIQQILNGQQVNYEIKGNTVIVKHQGVTKDQKENATHTVSGIVKDENGLPIIGATVKVRGAQMGVVTDIDGKFSLKTSVGSVLTVSYIGYKTQDIKVQEGGSLNIKLEPESKQLNEVVVTALGIKRSQKALSYNVQQVTSDELIRNKDANFINSLAGKVAGVNINTSSAGVGGASKVVMRGAKAIEQSSNALYVIDGVPMFNLGQEGGKGFESSGTTEAIADINPEDIESMSVLTGAAAAALYGSRAANGAIVITTKKGKVGHTEVTFSQNTEFLSAFRLPEFQNRYGTGSQLSSVEVADKSWGKRLNEVNSYGYDPKSDYLKTGVVTTETVTLSTGSEKNQTYLSASAVNSAGIVPNNKYNRYNFTFRNTTSFLQDRMTLDVGASYIKQNDLNMVNQGSYSNPLVEAYLFPRGDDWQTIKMYERYNTQRKIYTQYWPQGLNEFTGQNPYWINYRNLRTNFKDRYMLNAGLTYKILDWLNVAARIRVDNSANKYERKLYASSNTTLTEGSGNGFYAISKTDDKQTYGDLMVNINKSFENTLSLQANVGASLSDIQQDVLSNSGPLRNDLFANKFTVFQLDDSKAARFQSGYHDQVKSLFASVELGYKGAYYLTLTGRNDWPSQLAGPNSTQSSFFYPSVGTSFVLSEIFHLPKQIDYLKARASYASVGLPFPRFLANPTFEWDTALRQWKSKANYPLYNLKPENTTSWEIGLTARFLKHFNLDVTLYHTTTYNQTFNPQISVSSAYSTLYVQTGSVSNKGIELSLGYKNKWGDFGWASNYTFSANRNKINELVRNYVHPETGTVINKDRLDVGGHGQAHFILKEGGTLGDLYSLSDIKRDSQGRVYIDNEGKVYTDNNVGDIKLGSVFPKCNMAWRNDFSWKGLNVGLMFSARFGGIVYSATQATLDTYGVSETTAQARDLGYVEVNGGDHINPETWYTTIGSKNGVPQYYTYSATNIRLQEASIGYTIKKNKLWNVGDITLSLVGRNLLMLYCKAPFDPEATASTGNYYQGIDYFMTPSTRSIGFNVKVKF